MPNVRYEFGQTFSRYEFMADITVLTTHNKSCFVGARVRSADTEGANPQNADSGFFVAFSASTNARVYTTANGTWAGGVCDIPLPETFETEHKVIVEDDGTYLRYYMITSSLQKVLLLTADLSGETLVIYNGSGSMVWSGPNNLINNKNGYFKLFNHTGKVIVDNVVINAIPDNTNTIKKVTIKSATMSGFTQASPVEGTTIERAFDNNPASLVKVVGNPLGDNAHFTFDLGETYKLDNLVINFGTTRAHFYKILVSVDGNSFKEVKSYTSGDYAKTDGYYVKEEKLEGAVARYVRVVAYGTVASPGNQYYMVNEISIFGEDLLIPEGDCEYAGSQIRTVLVPYFKDGNIIEDDYRQGLRFCFRDLPDIDSTIVVDGKNYTVKKQSAMVILKDNLSGKGELTVNNSLIRSKMQILENLLDYSDESGTYKAVYIYNIPEKNASTTIVVRVFFECVDENGDVINFYGETKEDSLFSVYNRMDADQKASLSADVSDWFM